MDTVTPKKAALRADIFNVEILETLLEPEPEDEDDILTNVIQRRAQKVKQLSGSKKQRMENN